MLTPLTQTAIAILSSIGRRGIYGADISSATPDEVAGIYRKLESGGLIRRKADCPEFVPFSYDLLRSSSEITLLDILEATGEHLDCNHPTREEMYVQFHLAANRLGVVNHMTRLYLSEIKLCEL